MNIGYIVMNIVTYSMDIDVFMGNVRWECMRNMGRNYPVIVLLFYHVFHSIWKIGP